MSLNDVADRRLVSRFGMADRLACVYPEQRLDVAGDELPKERRAARSAPPAATKAR